jgi:hypothetical protein
MPRDWQLLPPQLPVPRNQVALQHFYPGPAGVRNRQQTTSSRWMERAVLLGLWLLVMLTAIAIAIAIAIGMRMLDLSVMPATPAEAPARTHASADAAKVMRSAALTAARPEDSDPFDNIIAAPPPERLPVPAVPPTRLTPATALEIKHSAAPLLVAVAQVQTANRSAPTHYVPCNCAGTE